MDGLIAFIAMATFVAFLATVVIFVPDLDMIIVFGVVSALASWDFWTSLRAKREGGRS